MVILTRLMESIREKRYVYIVFACSVLAFILVLSYFFSTNGRILNGVTVSNCKIGGLKVEDASRVLTDSLAPLPENKVVLNYNSRKVTVVLGALGFQADIPATIKKAYLVGRSGSIWSRIMTRLKLYRKGFDFKPVVKYNRQTLDSFYRLLDASIAIEPVRSAFTVDREGIVSFTPSREGRAVEYRTLTNLLEQAFCNPGIRQINIPIKTVIPPLNEADIENWGLNQVLGIYSTKFDPNQADRVENIKIACSAIDNSLIYPGQNFSFNTWVGPRATEAGYKEAPTIFMGKLIPGVGGGICQVSSTLYNAVLLANLRVLQRRNHTIPSAYVPLGRDATVVYEGIDFIFQNNYQKPILLVANVQSPYITVAILGEKSGWSKVSLESKTIETYPFKTIETHDPTLPEGERIRVSKGVAGSKVELWREVEFDDGHVERTLENTSIYPALPEEYKIGIKPAKGRWPRSKNESKK